MSSSALIAAKKRLETSLKKYEIPTVEHATFTESCTSGVLLLSLLQSRLHWTSSVFPRYKADPIQQPKRTNNSRKKWPNMKYLGTGTLELGPHLFSNTTFYEAKRSIPWTTIAKEQGLNIFDDDDTNNLEFIDIVFELNEIPNERFVFPKEALVSLSVEDGPIELHASFALPLDTTDGFFEKPFDQLVKWGDTCSLLLVREFICGKQPEKKEDTTIYEPANIRITLLNQTTIDAIEDNVYKPDQVKNSMITKTKSFPKKKFIKYDLSQDPIDNTDVQDLLKRAMTVPDITTGPIMAEKKRNEILNAIRLGKRPRDEKFEADLPKNKYSNNVAKEDGLLKCAYCSTRYTAMWRPGPSGHGTLCNSCGIQWKRGEILKGAPVISPQEEKRLLKEKKERERLNELVELEKEQKKIPKKVEDVPKKVAAPKVKVKSNIPEPKKIEETPPSESTIQAQPQQNNSFFLYSQGGIPLPTLSIDFGGLVTFSHPNCAVTLLDGHFHIRLCVTTGEQSLINLDKSDLADAQFEISQQGEQSAQREILTMTISPLSRSIQIHQQLLFPQQPITIQFLEKIDPSGGAVVKRILQRWLVTIPQ